VRPEIRWTLAAALALTIGVVCAEPYARLATPYYAAVARLISLGHPWTIVSVAVKPGTKSPSPELQLVGEVRRRPEDLRPAGRIISHVQVGEAVETPVVFWTLLLMWPANPMRQRLRRLAVGIPIFLGVEAITTAVQLVHSMAEVSAILAGEMNPVTLWERWSRFLEGGGQFVLACGFAILALASTKRFFGYHVQMTGRWRSVDACEDGTKS
jgi:hypothetical protein